LEINKNENDVGRKIF